MEILLTIIYVLVCAFLILVVLLQSGKAGDLASTFGGASSQTAFGSRGTANLLSKATSAAAALFLISALALALMSARKSPSRLPAQVPAAPAAVDQEPAPDAAPTPEEPPASGEQTGETQTEAQTPPSTPG